VQVQPTLIPTSWKLATDLIVQDLKVTESAEQSKPRHALFRDTLEEEDELPEWRQMIGQQNKNRFRIVWREPGWSTCVRYLVNRSWVNSTGTDMRMLPFQGGGFDAVAVLDADPGQPELSPTGMLTLTVLRGPLLQQPYHHMVAGANSSSGSSYDDDSDNDDMDHDHDNLGTSTSMRHQHGVLTGIKVDKPSFLDPSRSLYCIWNAAVLQSYENLVEKQKSGPQQHSADC
jgi:hypothetical protein